MKNLTIRPEVRYNWCPGTIANAPFSQGPLPVASATGNGTTANDYNNQFVFGIDAVLTF
jgi:hypothetical protein